MALTATEEALVRLLLDQQAALISLANSEATIISKLGATKVTLADLVAASAANTSDLLLTRQGTTDKSVTADVLRAFFASYFVDVTGDTMTGLLSLFAGSTVPTPAQFDNSTKLATTGFVQQALGNQSGVIASTAASLSLTASHAGKTINCYSVNQTLVLPAANTVPVGTVFNIVNAVTVTLNAAGTDTIYTGAVSASSLVLGAGDNAQFVQFNNSQWLAVGAVSLKTAAIFGASKAANGYQKLPSGLIIQWGAVNDASTAASLALVFPIAFPVNCASLICMAWQSQGTGPIYTHIGRAAAGATVTRGGTAGGYQYDWLAIGY